MSTSGYETIRRFVFLMAAGAVIGTFCGSLLLGIVPGEVLLPLLAVILALSAIEVWKHTHQQQAEIS